MKNIKTTAGGAVVALTAIAYALAKLFDIEIPKVEEIALILGGSGFGFLAYNLQDAPKEEKTDGN